MSATVADIGETAALARIIPRLPPASAAALGPGDDAAVVGAPDGRVVLTTDLMIEGPDFRLAWSSPVELGWKAAATNLADVAAMGAVPTALLVALAVPPETTVDWLEQLADGFAAACGMLAPGCGVVGGDLSKSLVTTIAVTAIGDLQGRRPVLRSGALPGDQIAYAGALGLAGAGLRRLFLADPDATGDGVDALRREGVLADQLRPAPPVGAGVLAAVGGAHAMLDVSDGLALDASRIALGSGVVLDLSRAALEPHVFAAGEVLRRRRGRARRAGRGPGGRRGPRAARLLPSRPAAGALPPDRYRARRPRRA